MKRAVKSNFKCSREDLNRLFACNRISALVWNKILELQREKFRSKSDLQKALKGLYPINSQSVQAVADKYCAACLATKSARDCGLANKYPWRRKNNYPTTWKADGFKLVGNRLKLSLGMFAGKRQPPIGVKLPNSTLEKLSGVKLQQISLVWDGWLKLAIVVDDGRATAPAIQSDKYLTYKLAAVGIELEKISEAYSTQTCPKCGRRHKCGSRNYRCGCGYIAHRDIHGARNVLSLGLSGRICITTPIKEIKYLRTA